MKINYKKGNVGTVYKKEFDFSKKVKLVFYSSFFSAILMYVILHIFM